MMRLESLKMGSGERDLDWDALMLGHFSHTVCELA